jgi:hypothetical protein
MPPVVAGKWMAWRAGLEKDLAWRAGFEDRNSSPLERLEPLVDEKVGGEKGRRVHRWSAAMARPEHLPVEQQPPQQQAATVYHCGRCCSCSSSQRTEQTTTRVTPHGAETGACSPTMGCVDLPATATMVTAVGGSSGV